MHILLGIIMAVGVLYLWLVGHWFGRVLAFIVFGGGGALLAGMLVATPHGSPVVPLAAGAVALLVAWFVSGIPVTIRSKAD